MLRTRVEILERAGQHGIAARLRDEIRGIEQGATPREDEEEAALIDEPDTEAADTETSVISALPTLKRRLVSLGIVSLADFQHWNHRRLKLCRFSSADIGLIYATMAALGLSGVIASGDVPLTVPEPYPYAFDLLAGRTQEDCDRYLDMLAEGVPQRRVSQLMGSAFGWHQVAGSLADRLSRPLAERVLKQLENTHSGRPWYGGAEVRKITAARKRPWGLAVVTRVAELDAVRACEAVRLNDRLRGDARWSWRGISILFQPQPTADSKPRR